MMKKNILKTTTIFMISLVGFLFTACGEVGLGEAVDIAAPTIEINYPPKNAIARDSFVVAGICSDDIAVSSVKLTFTNSSTKTVYGPYEASLNLERSQWSLELNQKKAGSNEEEYDAFNAYKQWELPDGSYIVTALAYDIKQKVSQEATIPLDIDNTAPVLLVSKPLATGNEKASVYGRTINITGDISEEHESAKLTLYYKEFDEETNTFIDQEAKTLAISGFGTMSSDSPLTIAKYNKNQEESAEDVMDSNYKKIYGEDINLTLSNKKLYYCGFMLEDNAKRWQIPGDQGLEGGNQTERYYILSDSYNEELFNENTYSLNARNLMLLLNGKSSYTEEEISQITSLLKKPGNSSSSTNISIEESTKFSVDPKNNPLWSITNFELWNNDFTTFEPGSAVPLVLQAGGDGISVDRSSIQVELYHLGTEPCQITADTPHAIVIKKGTYSDGLLKELLSPENEKSIEFYTDQDSETPSSLGLNVNHYYEIILTGTDISGNSLESKNDYRYGFRRLSSFAAPTISFRSGEDAFTQNEYQSGNKVKTDGIVINGTIVTADKDIWVKKENLELTGINITDISDSTIIVKAADAATASEEEILSSEVLYTYEITDFTTQSQGDESKGKVYYFTAKINKAAQKSNSTLIPIQEGAYKYKVTFAVVDSLSSKNEATDFEFKVDNKAPELSDSVLITPLVTKDDLSCVNGTISITGNISDTGSGFSKLSYAIGNSTPVELANPGFHWTFDFDTRSLEDNKDYILNIYAQDSVGNLLTIPCAIRVDQSTDNPQITFTNQDTIFSKASNVLVGNIKDDDGLDSVLVKYKKTSPVPEAEYTTYTLPSFTKGTTSYSLNVSLPASEGEYEIAVTANDIKGLSTGTKSQTITVKKDNAAPDFTIKAPHADKNTYYKDNVQISGTVKDGSGSVTISRDVYKVQGESSTKVPALCNSNLAAIQASEDQLTEKIVNGSDWTDTFAKTEEGGTYKIVYTATDKYNTSTEQTLEFSMDIDKPVIDEVTFNNQDITSIGDKWFKTNNGTFGVTTTDVTSSVVNAQCSLDQTNWTNMSYSETTNIWTAPITFEGTGAKSLYLKAIDKAGNESELKTVSLNIDTASPVLTAQGLSGTVYVNKTLDKTLTATYYDNANESGISPLKFTIGQTDITDKVTCERKKDAQGNDTNEYLITIPKDEFLSGLFTITGEDLAHNTSSVECCTFVVDQKAPDIKNIVILQTSDQTSTPAYKKSENEYFIRRQAGAKIAISGLAADEIFENINISVSDGEQEAITLDSTQDSWSFDNIDLSSWNKGSATVTITATDKIQNSVTKTFTLYFDETAPNLITGECPDDRYTFRGNQVIKFNNFWLGQGRYSVSSYGRMTSINVETYVEDKASLSQNEGSGLARLEYKLYTVDNTQNINNDTLIAYFNGTQNLAATTTLASSGTFAPLPDSDYSYFDSTIGTQGATVTGKATKATANISGFNTTASEKVNYLLLRPIDNCGNEGSITILEIHVDQTAPVIVTTSSEQLTNGSKPIDLSGAVYDEDAGLKALRVIIHDQTVIEVNNTSKEGNNLVTSVTNDYGTLSYTGYAPANPAADNPDIDPADTEHQYIFRDAPSYATWSLHLTPKVGNWFNSLGDNAEIYIEAEDWAEYDEDGDGPNPAKGNIAPNPTKAAILKIDTIAPEVSNLLPETASNKPTKINGINKISGNSSDTGSSPEEVSIYYSTEDTAPTEVTSYTKLQTLSTKGDDAVNVSKLYNFEFDVNFDDIIDAQAENQNVWILVVATDMAGNQSLVSPAKYEINRNTDRPHIKLTTEGINLSKMTSTAPVLLKEKQVYVNITDDDGAVKKAEFRTIKENQTVTDNELWQEFELKNGSGKFSLVDDGKQTVEFRITDSNDIVFTSSAANNWQRIYIEDEDGHILGDASSEPKIIVMLDMASPQVECLGIKLSIDDETAEWRDPKTFETILGGTNQSITLKIKATDAGTGVNKVEANVKLDEKTVTGSPYEASLAQGADTEPDVYTVTIPCASDSGVLNVEVLAYDGAERKGSYKNQFEVDNKKPDINVDSPDSNTEQSGTTTVIGWTSEVVNLWYGVSEKGESPAEYKLYSAAEDFSTSGFYIYFDSDTASGPNHTNKLNEWLVNLGVTSQAELDDPDPTKWFDTITELDLHLKAQDTAGNIQTKIHTIKVDPQGDRPKVEFTYPPKDEDDITLGGTINVMGSVSGKAQSYTVYMQFALDQDGNESWDDAAQTKTYLEEKGYSFESIPVINEQGIKISVDGDLWTQKINELSEFANKIKIAIYAVDNNNLISSKKEKTIKIDNNIPQIDEQGIKVVQWAKKANSENYYTGADGFTVDSSTGAFTFVSGAVKAIRNYSAKMSVSGQWYVIGKVTDGSGITKINFDGSKDSGASLTPDTLEADGSIIKAISGGYVFCFPVGNSTPDAVGITEVTLYAKDGGSGNSLGETEKLFTVIYDNQKPDVTPLGQDLEIINNNGFYTFKSSAVEQSKNGVNQTGVERVAFYFTRDITGTDQATTLFDPMIQKDKSGNKQSYASGFVYEDDLYWKTANATAITGNKLQLQSAPAVNVHVGGLAKVNGIIYRIDKIEASEITLSGNPGDTASAANVLFAIANVIDHKIPEDLPITNEKLNVNSATEYGYGYFKSDENTLLSVGDDGDLMPERFNTVGTNTSWQASINSKNLGDGPVTLHYIVFDKAGNYTYLTSSAKVQNNAPRIAGAYIGTDEDGDGTVESGEFKSYHNAFENGFGVDGKKATNVTLPADSTAAAPVRAIQIKRDLVIKPEIIGGNGKIGYTYKVAKRKTSNDGWLSPYYDSGNSPVDLDAEVETDEEALRKNGSNDLMISISVKDFLKNLKENGVYAGDAPNQQFSFEIWDSTPGLTYGTDTQSAVMNVIMDVAINDQTPAMNKIIPFYWKSNSVNSLKDNSLEKGHIELSKDLAETELSLNPKVSGAIKLEGIAKDNSLLNELSVSISSYNGGNPVTIATYSNGSWTPKDSSVTITNATYEDFKNAGYIDDIPEGKNADSLVPEVSQEYGHVVHWTMEIDTEAMNLTPAQGINITVSAKDKGTPAYNATSDTVTYTSVTFANNGDASPEQTGGELGNNTNRDGTSAKYTCKYTIDIVPYIRGIKTKLSTKSKKADSSEYDRTALGHYPISKSEVIYLYGFNLAGGTLYDSAYETATAENKAKHKAALGAATTINTYDSYKNFTLYPTSTNALVNFTSGPVYVKAGAEGSEVESLNNKNFNNAQGSYNAQLPSPADYGNAATYQTFSNFYNRRPNSQVNNTLTDDTWLDVWSFNDRAAKPAAKGAIFDPIMKINPKQTGDGAGVIGFAYVSGTRRFSMANKSNSYQIWVGDYDNLSATGFAYDSAGNTYGTALGGDINKNLSNSKFAFMSSLWGPSLTTDWGTKAYNNGQLSPNKHQRIEQIGQVGTKADTSDTTQYIDKNRIQSPSIAVSGAGTTATVYLAYYDHLNQEIRFRWAQNPRDTTATPTDTDRGFATTQGNISYINDNYQLPNLGSNSNMNGDKYYVKDFQIIAETITGTTASLGNAGPYVSIDVIPNAGGTEGAKYDIVVIAWYDKENKNLMYTYNTTDLSAVTKTDFEGSTNTKTHWQTALPIFSDAGMYCQIKVAADGSIHFAGYDGDSGDIRYAKLSSYSDTSVDTCIVDSNGIVGSNLTLDVAKDESGKVIPYIGYYGSSGPKMAYLSDLGKAQNSVVAGAVNDMFTGYWEVTEIPTQSNAVKDRINVGVWKDANGVIKASTTGTNAHADETGNTSTDGSVYGNGTKNPVLGYEIRPSTDTGFMETTQKQ